MIFAREVPPLTFVILIGVILFVDYINDLFSFYRINKTKAILVYRNSIVINRFN